MYGQTYFWGSERLQKFYAQLCLKEENCAYLLQSTLRDLIYKLSGVVYYLSLGFLKNPKRNMYKVLSMFAHVALSGAEVVRHGLTLTPLPWSVAGTETKQNGG